MKVEDIKKYCMEKQCVTEEYPFGDVPICYKLNGKVFAQIYPYEHDYKITVKCTADAGQFLSNGISRKSGQRISLSICSTTILEYYLSR